MGRPRSAPSRSTGLSTSIHAPHAWGDGTLPDIPSAPLRLQSTPHMRGATVCCSCSVLHRFTSIHAPHAWGDRFSSDKQREESITSIHAPHAWGDVALRSVRPGAKNFNPRPTCVGRLSTRETLCGQSVLQSTPHMRGATVKAAISDRKRATSIHVPHAWGDCNQPDGFLAFCTSIHAPHAWGDAMKIIDNALKN